MKTTDEELTVALEDDTREGIRKHAKKLLRAADVLEVLPTPVDRLVEAAGLAECDEPLFSESKLKHASEATRRILRSVARRIHGTLDRRERVIYVAPELEGTNRGRFVQCHETMHDVLPWQRELLVFADDIKTLAPSIQAAFEQEANQGAAELLFQLDFFDEMARDYPTSLDTPAELSVRFGASVHASIRRWVEGHEHALCVAVLPPEPISDVPLKYRRQYLIESASWVERFGSQAIKPVMSADAMPFLSALVTPWSTSIDDEWELLGPGGQLRTVLVESLSTPFNTFVLFRVAQRGRLLSGSRKRPLIVSSR